MAKKESLTWADAPAAHDYPAAGDYLQLLASPAEVEVLTSLLERRRPRPSTRRTSCARPACRCSRLTIRRLPRM